jgi:chlorite dismutase
MAEPLAPAVGWGVLHLFCKIGPLADGEAVAAAVKAAEADDVQVVPVAMLGHKADVAFMVLGPDLWRLRQVQTELTAAGLDVVDSYVSLTELSEYAQGVPAEMKEARLHPRLPPEGKAAFCFYPMSKRRGDVSNWFTLPYDDRKELMYAHGASGREIACPDRLVPAARKVAGSCSFELSSKISDTSRSFFALITILGISL